MKHLLVISWAMPPMNFPRALQVPRLLRSIRGEGWRATVLQADPASIGEAILVDPALADMHCGEYYPISSNGSLRTRFLRTSKWVSEVTTLGDRLLDSGKFDALVTFAQPWEDHLIGNRLARRKRVPWLAHFSDPWIDSPYYADITNAKRRKWTAQEREIVTRADRLVFVTEGARRIVMQKYPPSRASAAFVLPHIALDVEVEPWRRGEALTIVHSGDLYGLRTPANFVEGVRRLAKRRNIDALKLVFVGAIDEKYRADIGTLAGLARVEILDRQTSTRAMELCRSADVLLLIDTPSRIDTDDLFMPSKLADYFAYRRWIMGLVTQSSTSGHLLDAAGMPPTEPNSPTAISDALEAVLDRWTNGAMTPPLSADKVRAMFSGVNVGRSFASILDDMVEE